ncbi:anti-sigma-28 factor, FlgM family [Hathewaya proteolytica DSM 3090]|uniref:Negative regulator of flagellin synthesis n=1 Tax=Hathewaya proteolytica DSM 3090 TaxID=1121331 RepID=A0A1M6LBX1_9CLOT|nr:flagellar biosynthesis anti-sigma factor FlgM [Hathewaya proteolytica]SHJ68707.1 anti-sigma-28 factor, FlgM family [Hathewaya proteolytica DSM 3090]
MKINNVTMNNVNNLYKLKCNRANSNERQKNENDSIQISSAGKNISRFFKEEIVIPDDKKVMEIKALVESGNYKVSSEELAKKLVASFGNKGI